MRLIAPTFAERRAAAEYERERPIRGRPGIFGALVVVLAVYVIVGAACVIWRELAR
jgi:hypothetical protein